MKVIFVGQNPANSMKAGDSPFKDTKSFDRLKQWIEVLKVTEPAMVNASNKSGKVTLKDVDKLTLDNVDNYHRFAGYKVVALGNYASKALKRFKIEHYKLPHPSGLNRLNNSKEYIDKQLELCYDWLRS